MRPALLIAGLLSALLFVSRAQAQVGIGPAGFGAPPGAVQVRAVPERSTVQPGERIPIAVVLDFQPKFHAWPNKPIIPAEFGADFPAIPTTVEVVSVPQGSRVGAIQWPAPTTVRVDYGTGPLDLISYTSRTVAFVPTIIGADQAPGEVAFDFDVGYQVCDDKQCYPPDNVTLRVPLHVVASVPDRTAPPAEPGLFAGFDPAGFSASAEAPTAGTGAGSNALPINSNALSINLFGRAFRLDPGGAAGLSLLLFVAALGGLLLNFTPCVLTVLPLKVMALSRAAEHNPGRLALLGVLMSLGVVAFWLAIGGAIAFIAGFSAISSLFQTGWFSAVMGLFMLIMALGMLGLFDVRLPQSVYRFNPSQDTLHGSFLFGVMAAVLSTPCTAPFMGSVSAWAATQTPPVTLTTFAAIGLGMAVPYFLLTLRPEWLRAVPRSGPGSVLVKQVMGLFMLAVAAFFLGIPLAALFRTPPDPVSRLYWWGVVFFIVAACAWLIYGTIQVTRRAAMRLFFGGIGVVIALTTLSLARELTSYGPIDWVYYTPERFAAAAAEGEVVVLDFTAEWCLNCKALEAGVLNREPVVDLLSRPGVTPMRVDLTTDNPDGRAKLKALGWVGIPLLAVFGSGTGYEATPLKYDSYTISTVQTAVEQAGRQAADVQR